MIKVNALGDACPLPVVKTINAIRGLSGPDTVETLVDNETAVENLKRLAENKGYGFSFEQQEPKKYRVVLTVEGTGEAPTEADIPVNCAVPAKKRRVVAVSSNCMGTGEEALGRTLMKAFLFAVRQLEELPDTILFYNSGAFVSCEGSESLDDLRALADAGVTILTCGTCLNYYGISEKLAVGSVTNMYSIVETLSGADVVIRP